MNHWAIAAYIDGRRQIRERFVTCPKCGYTFEKFMTQAPKPAEPSSPPITFPYTVEKHCLCGYWETTSALDHQLDRHHIESFPTEPKSWLKRFFNR